MVTLIFGLFIASHHPSLAPGHIGLEQIQSADGSQDSIALAIEQQRSKDMEWLRTSPTSYLAAIARVDFGEESTLTIGSDASNDVVIPGPVFKPRHMSVTVIGDSFRVQTLDPEATYTVGKKEQSGAMIVPSAYIYVGRFPVRLSHQRYPAVIVFDPQSPRFEEYKGFEYFPVDLRYRFELDMIRDPRPDTVVILSTRGNMRNALREGWFEFVIDGEPYRLEVSRLLEPGIGETMYSIFFRDKSSGKETYTVGRYLDIEQLPNGKFIIDFNRAYNPACAVSPYYNCPLPPVENTLPVVIPVGEKDSHYLDH